MTPRTPNILIFILTLFVLPATLLAQTSFDISALTGTSKVQRSQKRTWEKLGMGNKLYDNDIVETFFQSRAALQFGKGNILVLGSNSKILMNIVEKTVGNEKTLDVSITLFAGGVFANVVSGAHISIYTSNGVAETRKGSVSTVVEEKSGETGFQVLDGEVSVRNIAQQEGRKLTPGQTTMIFPGKQPTAPLYITYRHVAVLKHFFGDEYITAQLASAGIKPTEDASALRSRIAVSENLFQKNSAKKQDEGYQKYPFSQNKVYGAIIEDHMRSLRYYTPVSMPDSIFTNAASLGIRYDMSINGAGAFPRVGITGSYKIGPLSASLMFQLGTNYEQFGLSQFYSADGALSLIDRITLIVPETDLIDTLNLHIGRIFNLTLGDGLIVNRFSNANEYLGFSPAGILVNYAFESASAQFFVADAARFSVGGISFTYYPSLYHLGVGYYWDANQIEGAIKPGDYRFINIPKPPDSLKVSQNIFELYLGMDILQTDEITLTLSGALARSAFKPATGTVWRIPALSFAVSGVEFGGGFIVESRSLAYANMHSFYMSNRVRLDSARTTYTAQNMLLSNMRKSNGYNLFFKFNPLKGCSVDAEFRQELKCSNVFTGKELDSTLDKPGISLNVALSLNKNCIPVFEYGKIYLNQVHTSIFPPHGAFFSSWGTNVGLDLLTIPLVMNIAFSAGFKLDMIDISNASGKPQFNNRVDAGDITPSFYISGIWGFL